MIDLLKLFFPLIGFVFFLVILLWGIHWILIGRHADIGNERKLSHQLILLVISLIGLLVVVLLLPISDGLRNKLLGLIGILFSGIIAFSSTTILSNLAAGMLLRITKPFKTGDFIRIGDYFGRVSERGLFDTEIQTETRELVSLPNTFCINNPVTTTRSSGTIISASLSLGYDVDHSMLESILVKAAINGGLEEPFVHILELGDFSVTYRVSGFLAEPKLLISARSKLYGSVLDTLHGQDIEIVSPAYMNQRRLEDGYRAIPTSVAISENDADGGSIENIAFDKAERAGQLEEEKMRLLQELTELDKKQKQAEGDMEKSQASKSIEKIQERLKEIEKASETIKSEPDEGGKK